MTRDLLALTSTAPTRFPTGVRVKTDARKPIVYSLGSTVGSEPAVLPGDIKAAIFSFLNEDSVPLLVMGDSYSIGSLTAGDSLLPSGHK
jgi:hypothetical protein